MRALHCLWLTALAVPLALAGCQGGPATTSPAADKGYDFKGKVVSVGPGKSVVTVDHEDIPGLMKAMTMEFRVEDAKLLEGLKAGDQVQGRLKKTDSGYLITRLEKR
jgi:protein SCO1